MGLLSSFCRAEYQQRLTQGGMKGMSISQWQDFQKFLLRLNKFGLC